MGFEVIPAIDLRGGRCVRLTQGDYERETIYGDDPVRMALKWQAAGASRLHVVDLDAARSGSAENLPVVAAICEALTIPVQMGGGVRDADAVRRTLDAGVGRAILGTAAARNPDLAATLFKEFGDRLILGVDARDGRVAVAGWRETTEWTAVDLVRRLADSGARRVIYTDIATDGMGTGPSLESTHRLATETGVSVIASGGIGSEEHIRSLAVLTNPVLEGVIVGRALYTGAVDLAAVIGELRGAAEAEG